jgi:hypothetical protein
MVLSFSALKKPGLHTSQTGAIIDWPYLPALMGVHALRDLAPSFCRLP